MAHRLELAELKYNRIIAVGGRGFELWPLKVQKNAISSICNLTQVDSYDLNCM